MSVLNYGAESISVGFEEVESQDWAAKVYKSDILQNSENVDNKPGYNPFEK
jgi:4-oxalocrotonate tautomerase